LAIETSYTDARSNFARYLDEVIDNQQIVIVSRRGKEDVAMISASELSGLVETAHLMRSPKNAQRLLAALQSARANQGTRASVNSLKHEVGLGGK
jgi:antitoxin YefM